ncbi:MAG: thiamine phosphate synthase [Vicinamibacterales bacterium]
MVVSDRRRLARASGGDERRAADLLVEQAAAAAEFGADFFQLREPDLDAAILAALAARIRDVVAGRLVVLVNDRADVAAAAGVGVHLTARSLPADRLRRWMPRSTYLTRAVHSPAEAAASGPVDAVVAGTAAASASKPPGHPVLGPDGLRAIVEASGVPVLAIGGLTARDWPWLAEAGAAGCAGIGAFLPQPGERVAAAVARGIGAFRGVVD